MRDLLTYHGGLSLPGLFMFICEIIFVYALYLFMQDLYKVKAIISWAMSAH